MDRSTISELVPRTLKARLDVFTVLFDLVDGWFALSVDRCQLSKPQLGILKSLPGIKIPWPNAVEQRVNGTLGFFTSNRPIRFARDLARAWP